jgi:hypothetical protein
MIRFFTPFIIIGFAAALFFVYIKPTSLEINMVQKQIQEAQSINNDVKIQIDKRLADLEKQKNSIDVNDRTKAKRIVPLEKDFDPSAFLNSIDTIATTNLLGKKMRGVSYSQTTLSQITQSEVVPGTQTAPRPSEAIDPNVVSSLSNYSTFQLSFNVEATHENFLKFIKDIESNEQLVDVTSLAFSVGDKDINTYQVSLLAYLLK